METKELINRYVFAVGQRLPAKQRQDITEELRSSLWDSLEDRFGPQPNLDQAVGLLKELGSPEKVAASYWPAGQYLIGPDLYPLYRTILNILTVIWLVGGVASLVGLVALGGKIRPWEWATGLLQGFVGMFGGLTLVFAILQRVGVQGDDDEKSFNPMRLPKVEHEDLVSRAGQLVGLTVGVIVLGLLAYLPSRIDTLFPDVFVVRLPAVEAMLGWIVVSILLGLVLNLVLLVRGRWSLFTRMAKIGINLFSMTIVGVILNSHIPLVDTQGMASELASVTEMGVTIGLGVTLVVLGVDTAILLYGMLKRYILAPSVKRLT